MSITLGYWIIPSVVTVTQVVWLLGNSSRHGDYDFTPLLTLGISIIVILAAWLAYFAGLAVFA